MQPELNFLHDHENNRESEKILSANYDQLNKQCRLVLDLMMRGERLTVRDAMINHSIGDLRRRVKDLKELGFDIKSEMQENRFKIYFL